MSSSAKKPGSKPPQSGQKRSAPVAATPSKAAGSAKKAKLATPAKKAAAPAPAPSTPRLGFAPPSDDDEDDAAFFAQIKAKGAAASVAAAAASADDEDDFEVAAGSGDEAEAAPAGNAPPSEDEDEDMRDADESEEEEAAPAPTPKATPAPKAAAVKAASPKLAAVATPAKPAAAAKAAVATPAAAPKPTPAAAKATPAKASPALKPATPAPAAKKVAAPATPADDSETSESEDESPAPAKPATKVATPVAAAAAAKPASKVTIRSTLADSSESSESDDDETPAAAATPVYRKPTVEKKPTPLKGDASVNPPAKPAAAKTKAKTAAPGMPTPGTSATFDKPLTRPPTAPHTGRSFTVSIALPGSIIGNAQSKELRTYVAGQIARACATFNVDEIVVFAEEGKQTSGGIKGNFEGATRSTDPDVFMARILQYLETPQYLRKLLFPKHVDLANAGLLNPLDSPHHVRADEEAQYREGVVVNRPVAKTKSSEGGCWANIGLKNEAFIERPIEVGTRLTVHIPQLAGSTTRKQVVGRAVAPSTPREKNGTYWGYTTRLAQSLSQVWSECPFKGGYDLSVGTSEHGVDCHAHDFELPPFKHAILFFGGLAGLEEHIAADESINVKTPDQLFQLYINSVIGQGCRTIRTEEAVPITLAALYRHIRTNQPPQTE